MKKYIVSFFSVLSLSLSVLAQQTIEITGIVTDMNKEPLIGVNIVVKDVPGMGTVTDVHGRYKIRMEPFHRLVFSYIGFEKQEVLIKEQTVVDVEMKEDVSSTLDEIVVTGTGPQKKLTVTGAITNVEVEQLKTNPTASLVNSLAGNVAGVYAMQTSGQPGKNISEFWIRGISTFGAHTNAYVLVDGFPRDINDVNVEDIESFSVLKDASATAIYGDKGANGVVLITTKRGKAGKVNIQVKVESSYNTRTITPDVIDGNEYVSMVNEAKITRNQEPIYTTDELEIIRRNLDPDLYPNVDWGSVLLKKGAPTYRASVNMNGGGSTARYYVSMSYIDEKGMYKSDDQLEKEYYTNADYRVFNYRLNTDLNITRTSVLKVGVAGKLSKQNNAAMYDGYQIWHSIVGTSPVYIPVMYSNGYVPASGLGERTNPWLQATQSGYSEHWINDVQTNATWEQDLDFVTPGLDFTANIGYDLSNANHINRIKWPKQWRAERMRDANGDLIFQHIAGPAEMYQESSASGRKVEFAELWLNYNRSFVKVHNVGGTLKWNADSQERTDNVGSDIKEGIPNRHESLAGRLTYNYALRYFIDFNFGYTGSENFAKDHKWGFFPAFSFAWNIGEEKIVKEKLPWIGMCKIRYSDGRVGNDEIGTRIPYLYTLIVNADAGYNWGDYYFNNIYSGLYYSQIASTGITWEQAVKRDLGMDLALWNDKLQLTADYFNEFRNGIYYIRYHLPAMVGLESNPKANVGKVHSTGVDGNFTFHQKIDRVNFTMRGNWTYSKNRILDIDEENSVYPYQMQKGRRVNQVAGLVALGLFEDYEDIRNSPTQQFGTYQPGDIKYADVNGDGVVNDGDITAIGATRKPNLIYGFGTSLQWKGLDVNVHFQGAGKSSFLINGPNVYAFNEGIWGNVFSDLAHSKRWIDADISGDPATEDPNAEYPRLSYNGNSNNYRASSFWMRDGRYLRLKTLEVGYTFPKQWVTKMHLNSFRLFFIGTNLVTWSKFKMWDPELGSSTGEEYPIAKVITLGATINI